MRPLLALLAVITVGTLSGCPPSSSSDGTSGPYEWITRAPLPIPRTEMSVLAIGSRIYVLGGSSGSTLARVDEYDTATGAWTRKADMRAARRSFVAGVIGGRIYVGPGLSWTDLNTVTAVVSTEVYDPATDTWTELAPCPSVSAAGIGYWGNVFYGGGAVDGRLYAVAVTSSGNFTFEYDPATDAWRTRAPSPLPVFYEFTATVLGGELYAFSSNGFPANGFVASYDPVDDVWITRPGLPGYSHPALVVASGKLYALGGWSWGPMGNPSMSSSSLVHEFDPATGAWTERGSFRTPRERAGAANVGGHLFVIGGDVWSSGTIHDVTPSAVVEEGVPR